MDGRANHGWIGTPAGRAHRAAGRIVPWGISLLFHAAIAAAAAWVGITVLPDQNDRLTVGSILVPQSAEKIAASPQPRRTTIAPAAAAVAPTAPGPEPMHPAPASGEPLRLADLTPSPYPAAALGPSLAPGSASPLSEASPLGPGLAFHAPPRSSLLGAGGNAHHVVYVIDRSGSMIGTFDEVRRAVLLSIGHLRDDQDFHVILFAQGRAIESPPARLVPPTEDNKLQAATFLAAARAGFHSDPLPALRRAFDVLADAPGGGKLIYLISDGVFPDGPAVTSVIRSRNKDKLVRINTYYCGGDDPSAQAMLQTIARNTGGLFRLVGASPEGP